MHEWEWKSRSITINDGQEGVLDIDVRCALLMLCTAVNNGDYLVLDNEAMSNCVST